MKKLFFPLITLLVFPFSCLPMSNLARLNVKFALFRENPAQLARALNKGYAFDSNRFDYEKLGIIRTDKQTQLGQYANVKNDLDAFAKTASSKYHITKKLFDIGQFAVLANSMEISYKVFMGGLDCCFSGGATTLGSVLVGLGSTALGGSAYLMRRIVVRQNGSNFAECAKIINQAREQFTNGLF